MSDTFTLSASEVLDALESLCSGLGPAQGGCEGAVGTLRGMFAGLSVTLPTPQGVLDELAEWKEKAQELQEQLGNSGGGDGDGPAPGTPLLPGGDPMEPLRRLAEAINEAENTLNLQNLIIASGSAEVSLVVEVGGAAAQASVRLDIQPRPFQ